jgi:mannan polymerase complexes MNN9 subunit
LQTDKYGVNKTYDRNNWVETEESRKFIRNLRDDDLTFEGYTEMNTGRKYLGDTHDPSGDLFEMLELDGIGGTSLLVSANLHRDGLVFPVTPVDHAIETEGLCKVAKKMGVTSYGLPNYVVLHE